MPAFNAIGVALLIVEAIGKAVPTLIKVKEDVEEHLRKSGPARAEAKAERQEAKAEREEAKAEREAARAEREAARAEREAGSGYCEKIYLTDPETGEMVVFASTVRSVATQ